MPAIIGTAMFQFFSFCFFYFINEHTVVYIELPINREGRSEKVGDLGHSHSFLL